MALDWLLHPFRSRTAKKRPWVSAQFLGIAAALGVLSLGLYGYVSQGPGSPGSFEDAASRGEGPEDPLAPLERAYVGYADLAQMQSAPAAPGCLLECRADAAYDLWKAQHAGVEVVSKEPVQQSGATIGFWVEYRMPQASQAGSR